MKRIPQFQSEDEEQAFWDKHDSIEFVDWSAARRTVLPNLRPSTKTISLRLPEHMLEDLAERIEEELRGSRKKVS